jgi:hypothetical protein
MGMTLFPSMADWGFLLAEQTSLMLKNSNNYWKELPVKLPPLSYMQHTGEKV